MAIIEEQWAAAESRLLAASVQHAGPSRINLNKHSCCDALKRLRQPVFTKRMVLKPVKLAKY
jgi:hypothetical protein